MHHQKLVFAICLAILAAGCSGGDGPATYPVAGTVTFDGQPIKEGDILFVSDNPAFGPDAGKITDGRFSLMAKEGKMRVKITAVRELPGPAKKGAMGEEIKPSEQFIPPCYNDKTTLTVNVPLADGKEIEFALASATSKKNR